MGKKIEAYSRVEENLREGAQMKLSLSMLALCMRGFHHLLHHDSRGEIHHFHQPPPPRQRTLTLSLLSFIQLFDVRVAYIRFPTFNYMPYHAPSKLITADIWKFSLDNDILSSVYRIRDALRNLKLDVVGLLEMDLQP
jgi:hypothetical protein